MPELPEVETIRRGLAERLRGAKILSVDVRVPKMFVGDPKSISHSPITAVRRIAKVLIIDFARGKSLIIHLKMTGQLVYVKDPNLREDSTFFLQPPTPALSRTSFGMPALRKKVESSELVDIVIGGHPEKVYEQPLPHKHTHIIYHLTGGATLYYNDLRKFGWHKVVATDQIGTILGQEFAGVDVLSPDFTFAYFQSFLKKRPNRPIKEAIMEQRYIAGLGNIYAAEALWHARINPLRKAGSLTGKEQKALYEAIKQVIDLSLKTGGSTFNSYVDAAGKTGTFMRHAAVYKKAKDPFDHEVKRIKQGGRTTHFCPICQR